MQTFLLFLDDQITFGIMRNLLSLLDSTWVDEQSPDLNFFMMKVMSSDVIKLR